MFLLNVESDFYLLLHLFMDFINSSLVLSVMDACQLFSHISMGRGRGGGGGREVLFVIQGDPKMVWSFEFEQLLTYIYSPE